MRGAMVYSKSPGSSANFDTQSFPREGLLKNTLAEVTGKKERVGSSSAKRSKKAQLGYANILRLVYNSEIKGRIFNFGEHRSKLAEQAGICDQIPNGKFFSHALKYGPKHSALLLGQSGFSAEPHDITTGFPSFQLPCVYNLFQFRQ